MVIQKLIKKIKNLSGFFFLECFLENLFERLLKSQKHEYFSLKDPYKIMTKKLYVSYYWYCTGKCVIMSSIVEWDYSIEFNVENLLKHIKEKHNSNAENILSWSTFDCI